MRSNLYRIWILAAVSANAWAQHDDLEVTLTPDARKFCHIIQFPQAWAMRPSDAETGRLIFGSSFGDYEFRTDGPIARQFLVAGFTEPVATRYYTTNRFRVDLSNASVSIREVSREDWDSAKIVPFTRRSAIPPGGQVPNEEHLHFNGFQFNRTGEIWAQPSDDYATRLSPDEAWVVLQSEAIKKTRGVTKVFLDFFNLKTGQKAFTIDGAFSSQIGDGPEQVLKSTGWITERFFIAPLGRLRERALACEFGATGPAASKR